MDGYEQSYLDDVLENGRPRYTQKQKDEVKQCPNERETHRTTMRRVFEQMEQLNPEVRYSVWSALEKAGKLVEIA